MGWSLKIGTQRSDIFPNALHAPVATIKGFHPSAAIAFNRREFGIPRRLEMAVAAEKSIKRTIRRLQLREMVPLADSTIDEMEQRGEIPRRFALSPRCVVWDLAEVEAWLASRRSNPIDRAQSPDVRQRRSRPVREPGRAQTTASRSG
jgi:prophage regulatory protein